MTLNSETTHKTAFLGLPFFKTMVMLVGLLGTFLGGWQTANADGLLDEALPASWQSEAALNDVCFIDRQHGWAAGDHGTILRTSDGGETWKTIAQLNQTVITNSGSNGSLSLSEKLRGVSNRQVIKSGPINQSSDPKFTCQLTGIFFLDQQHGWACGGYALPYLDRTQSVVLRTADGGMTWRVLHNTAAPALKQIHFTSLRSGWAVGEGSHKYRSGIYFTHNGGTTWSSDSPETKKKSWRRAARNGPNTIAVSDSGAIGFSQPTSGNPTDMDAAAILGTGPQHFSDVAIAGEKDAWAVGRRGAIFRSADNGLSFRPAKLLDDNPDRQQQTLSLIDFETMTVTEDKIWAAGKPGSCLVSIDRKTLNVAFHKTPVTTPIHKITFVDANTGFAVGDLGVILSTVDGGKTWEVRRGKHKRLDILNICKTDAHIPFNLLADLACENNLLCGTMLLSKGERSIPEAHIHQAAARCGNATMTLAIDSSDKADPAASQIGVLQNVVKHVRQYRPACVVINGVDESLVTQAIYAAADTRVLHADQTELNLRPWQVKRMVIADLGGSINIGSDKLLPLEGQSIADRVLLSRSLLGMSLHANQSRRTWRMVRFIGRGDGGQSTTAVPVEQTSLLKGIGQVAGRAKKSRTSTGLAIIERGSQKRQMFARLLKTDIHDEKSMSVWQNDLLTLTLAVDRQQAGNWMMELADEYFAAGDPELASRTLQLLSTRWSEHAYAPVARLWLATYFSSDEFNLKAFFDARNAAVNQLHTQATQPNQLASHSAAGITELTQIQTDQIGNGDQRLSWQAPDPDQLKKQIAAARRQRMHNSDGADLSGDSDLAELVRLANEVDQELGSKHEATAGSEPQSYGSATDEDRLDRGMKQIKNQFNLDQWLEQRHRLATKFLNRLKNQDADLAQSFPCQLLNLKLTLLSTEPHQRVESLQQKLRLASDPQLKQWINLELAVLQAADTTRETRDVSLFNALAKPVIHCVQAQTPPQLDGVANDLVWQSAYQADAVCRMSHSSESQQSNSSSEIKLVSFETPAADVPVADSLLFAHDDKFLYLLAVMSKLPNEKYRTSAGLRSRDPDLTGRDRIEVELDIDRDGQTNFRFAIDYRGWAAESINGMSAWDPTWFVQGKEGANNWTVEAAIPLASLWGDAGQGAEAGFSLDEEVVRTIGDPTCWSIGLRRSRWANEDFWNTSSGSPAGSSLIDLIDDAASARRLLIFD